MTPRAYLFDLDGTLVDTAPDLNRALNHALAAAGLEPVDEALTRHWVGHGVRAMLEAAFEHRAWAPPPERADELEGMVLDYYGAHIADASAPYPDVEEALAVLAHRAPLAVVTNKRVELSVPLLDAVGLSGFFEVVVGRGVTRRHKPHAEPALYALGRLGAAPADALFVGDSETDVACARAAGCPIALYRYGYNHGRDPDALGADRVIDSFRELV